MGSEDGLCYIYRIDTDDDDPDISWVEDHLKYEVFEQTEPEGLIQVRTRGSDAFFSLEDFFGRRDLFETIIQERYNIGDSIKLNIARYHQGQVQGFRCFWSMLDTYEVLKLSSYNGSKGDWAAHMFPSFNQTLVNYWDLGTAHCRRSGRKFNSLDANTGMTLPWPALSTHAFLALLTHWSAMSPKNGGFTSRNDAGLVMSRTLLTAPENTVNRKYPTNEKSVSRNFENRLHNRGPAQKNTESRPQIAKKKPQLVSEYSETNVLIIR